MYSSDNTPYEKVGKNEPVSIADEVPFDIPDSWEWCRLGDIFYHNTGKALNASNQSGQLLEYITTSNLYWNRFELGTLRKMFFTDSEIEKCTAAKGDLLVCEGGDFGRAAIWPFDYDIRIQNHIHRLRAYAPVCTEYYYYIFYLYKHVGWIGGKGIGIQGLSSNALHALLFPLPPVEEQKRIVDIIRKIDPITEKYEIAEAKLDALNTGFPDQLKKSILQMAVQGKLVPQDPDDEPANVLLERIRAEKERLIAEGKIKRDKNESVIYRRDNSHYEKLGSVEQCIDDEIPFEIPPAWSWVRLRYISFKITDGTHKTPSYLEEGVPFVSAKDVIDGLLSFRKCRYISEDEHQKLSERCNPEKGDLLITKSGTIGSVAVINDDFRFSLFESLALVKYDQHNIDKNYLRYSIQSAFEYLSKDNIRGVAVKHLPIDSITNILIPLPSFAEQQRIVQQIEAILPMVKSL